VPPATFFLFVLAAAPPATGDHVVMLFAPPASEPLAGRLEAELVAAGLAPRRVAIAADTTPAALDE
jgi:hypothetical protein